MQKVTGVTVEMWEVEAEAGVVIPKPPFSCLPALLIVLQWEQAEQGVHHKVAALMLMAAQEVQAFLTDHPLFQPLGEAEGLQRQVVLILVAVQVEPDREVRQMLQGRQAQLFLAEMAPMVGQGLMEAVLEVLVVVERVERVLRLAVVVLVALVLVVLVM